VILGDNIIERNIQRAAAAFRSQERGAKILLKRVPDPQRFGVAMLRGRRVERIVEKPRRPPSRYAVTGIYFFDHSVFEYVRDLKPSKRGELEITDVNNRYIAAGTMTYEILTGWWTDAGTFESLQRASRLVARAGANKV
jgi:glucose-1-phosphate thymidylyltransferase